MIFLNAILGGLLIGAAASVLVYFLGRIMGVSGILAQALSSVNVSENAWRWVFVGGTLAGALLVHHVFAVPVPDNANSGLVTAIAAGLLVGFGVNLGSGCTSGHGICGMARLSTRSIVATGCFMAAGILTVFIGKWV